MAHYGTLAADMDNPPAPAAPVVAPAPVPAPVVAAPPAPVQAPPPPPPPLPLAAKGEASAAPSPDVALKARVDAMEAALKRAEVARAADRHGAADVSDVYSLLSGDLDVIDGAVVVRSAPTVPLDAYVGQWLQKKPHMLRPAAPSGGAGASSVVQAPTAAAPVPPPHTSEGGTAVVNAFLERKFPTLRAPAGQPPPARL